MKSILIICVVLVAHLWCVQVSVQAQEIIADTRADFSLVAQGTNGFQYGYYTADNVKGTFITTGMTVAGSDWNGTGPHGTPVTGETFMHPATSESAVRRYTVGTNGEPAIDGFVVIEGKFWDAQTGNSNGSIGFVTINGMNFFAQDIPEGSTSTTGYVSFSILVEVYPNTTIDFGVTSKGNALFDGRAMEAVIRTSPIEPFTVAATPIDDTTVDFIWPDIFSNEISYSIERSDLSNTGFTEMAALNANTSYYRHTPLQPGERFYFRLKAVLNTGTVFYSRISEYANLAEGTRETIADTEIDFLLTQGANGFQYGYYTTDAVTGTFSTAGMTAGGNVWRGTGLYGTPLTASVGIHPGQVFPAVRRYTVGSNGEPGINGKVVIEGKFWDNQSGNSNGSTGFVTVDGVNAFAQDIPEGSTSTSGFLAFRIEVQVHEGSTIDFGVTPKGHYGNDGRAMVAVIGLPAPRIFRAIASGNWSDPMIWETTIEGSPVHQVPESYDIIEIKGVEVNVNGNQECGDILLSSEVPGTRLLVSSGVLAVNGKVSCFNHAGVKENLLLVQDQGSLEVRGDN